MNEEKQHLNMDHGNHSTSMHHRGSPTAVGLYVTKSSLFA